MKQLLLCVFMTSVFCAAFGQQNMQQFFGKGQTAGIPGGWTTVNGHVLLTASMKRSYVSGTGWILAFDSNAVADIMSHSEDAYARFTILKGRVQIYYGSDSVALCANETLELSRTEPPKKSSDPRYREIEVWSRGTEYVYPNFPLRIVLKDVGRWYNEPVVFDEMSLYHLQCDFRWHIGESFAAVLTRACQANGLIWRRVGKTFRIFRG